MPEPRSMQTERYASAIAAAGWNERPIADNPCKCLTPSLAENNIASALSKVVLGR
jgi:hypothetical protein